MRTEALGFGSEKIINDLGEGSFCEMHGTEADSRSSEGEDIKMARVGSMPQVFGELL